MEKRLCHIIKQVTVLKPYLSEDKQHEIVQCLAKGITNYILEKLNRDL